MRRKIMASVITAVFAALAFFGLGNKRGRAREFS